MEEEIFSHLKNFCRLRRVPFILQIHTFQNVVKKLRCILQLQNILVI